MNMNDRVILDQLLRAAWDDLQYFSNANKPARERWVVAQFLEALSVPHLESDLQSLENENKVDVRFREAAFQVKELTEPDLRRGQMYKDDYESIKAANRLEDVSLVGQVCDAPPVANMYDLVVDLARELSEGNKYREEIISIDLLVYVTRSRAALIRSDELDQSAFSGLGWRSVSCVNTKQSVVLYAADSAPEFIKEAVRMAERIRK